MKQPARRTTKAQETRIGRSPTLRKLDRARAALHDAVDSDAWVKATFRLMLATAPSSFASAALRCSQIDAALWINSKGARLHSADFPRVMVDHPGIRYLMEHPGLKVLPTRGVLPPQEKLEKTVFYREFLVAFGWRHAVGLCFWKGGETPMLDCVMSANRTAEEGDFSDEEIKRIGALHAEIDRIRVRVTALEEERAARSSYEHFADHLPIPVAMLGWDLQPLYHNQLAREACALWHGGPAARQQKTARETFHTPAELLEACRGMQGEWRERIRSDSRSESVLERVVSQAAASGMRATVRLLFLTGSTLGNPTFMIQFDEPDSAHEGRAPNLAALLCLTPAERAAASLAAAFKSNAEIATALGRSIGTVKAGLHSAYKKLGVRTRAELASLLRG